LQVEVSQVSGGYPRIAEAIAAGALDVGIVDPTAVANAVLHGLDLAVFGGGAEYAKSTPTMLMVTLKSNPYRAAKDLEGQTIGVAALQSLPSSGTVEWLRSHGADPTKIKLFELPSADMSAALARGTIAAALQGEPFLFAARNDQRALGDPFDALGPFYINAFAAKRTWLAANTALARQLMAVLYRAGQWAMTNPDDSAALESKYTKIPVDVVRAMGRNTFATSFNPQYMSPILNLAVKYSVISQPVSAEQIAFRL
jgi:ABC-type nitrate/sulfonate/bicarbonate transport system substrate-binding protein